MIAGERRWIDFRSDEEIVIFRREILTYLYLISQILTDANKALKNSYKTITHSVLETVRKIDRHVPKC